MPTFPRFAAAVVAAMALLLSAPVAARMGSTEEPITCPNDATTVLSGEGPQRRALLVYFAGQPVGGGVVGADGRWEIPILVHESPGIYPVEVRTRDHHTLVKRFNCFVDQPIDAPTATLIPTAPASPRTPTATALTATAPATATASPEVTVTQAGREQSGAPPTRTQTSASPTAGTTATPGATNTPVRAATLTPTTPPVTTPVTPVAGVIRLEISDIGAQDPANLSDIGYVVIENLGTDTVSIQGWSIGSTAAGRPRYTFPQVQVAAETSLILEVGAGANDFENQLLYWGRSTPAWESEEIVVLSNSSGVEVFRTTVP